MKAPDRNSNGMDAAWNQKTSTYDKDESFDDSDDFHKHDTTQDSNLDAEDPIVKSDDATNRNAKTKTPTFTRTHDRNASDVGKFDGTIGI